MRPSRCFTAGAGSSRPEQHASSWIKTAPRREVAIHDDGCWPPSASADLFGQSDDDARGVAEIAEPEDALVLRRLAEELGAMGA
jgi:hypothetical protein